jgi:probable F420-dependent oxidoreductase
MKFGFGMIYFKDVFGPEMLGFLAQKAEELGFESLWAPEHVAFPLTWNSRCETENGEFPEEAGAPWPSPLLPLAYAAALTKKLKFGTSVIILPHHHPLALAKDMATLDVLSSGRAILGVGGGWLKEEFDQLAIDFHTRGARCDEALAAMRSLWRENPSSFHGKHFNFGPVMSLPKPVRGDIPIFVAGHSRAAARRTARFGDGMFPASTLANVREAFAMLREECGRIGRNPGEVELMVGCDQLLDPELWRGGIASLPDMMKRYEDLGVARVTLSAATTLGTEFDRDTYARRMEEIAARIIR